MDRLEKAFDFAADAAKQMIVLSTGIIALTVTLLKDVLNNPAARTRTLDLAWLAFAFSVGFGLWFLLALTGSLASKKVCDAQLSINKPNARIPMWGQLIAFLIGLGLTITLGMTGLRHVANQAPGPNDATGHPTPSEATKISSIGPFLEADTALEQGDWPAIEKQILDSVDRLQSRADLGPILVLAGVDQRRLSASASARFEDNRGLAAARAEATRSRVQALIGGKINVVPIAMGALHLGPQARGADWRQDRRVDVYVITTWKSHEGGR